ncbi:MAG: NAD(P)-dependent alcohol dehydrogenase [Planctomycetia bacterium]|nr:NAD(P)-dependent alcohol dehydrogenase [Planctomycetia bacterium]
MKKYILLLCTACVIFGVIQKSRAEEGECVRTRGFAVFDNSGKFKPYEFTRHAVGENDILIEILYCGICHTDVHYIHEDWGKEEFPMVPGHEIAGRVVQVGKKVTKFKVGDYAGVGCMVNSCGKCDACSRDWEMYCPQRVLTYPDKDPFHGNTQAQGGYANNIVVSEKFAIKIPEKAKMEKVAPLFCAGITTYSPIRYANIKKGDVVAVAGFGGLGHMAVQYLVALGAEVTVFDVTEEKREDALRLGAKKYVNVKKAEEMKGLENTFRFILSTIPAKHDPVMYIRMLAVDGEMAVAGIPAAADMAYIPVGALVSLSRRKVYGTLIGGISQTQEMLDYSVENGIYPEVEIIPADPKEVSQALENLRTGKAKFRYVIDMRTLNEEINKIPVSSEKIKCAE